MSGRYFNYRTKPRVLLESRHEVSRDISPEDDGTWPWLWMHTILSLYFKNIPHPSEGIQSQIQLLRFLRRHRLEGVAFLSPCAGESKIYRKTVEDIARRYSMRVTEQLDLWRWFAEWADKGEFSLIPIKGLSLTLQSDIPQYFRFFEDIDVLVNKTECNPIISFLLSEGFFPRHNLSQKQAVVALNSLGSLNFFRKNSICSIDLHLNIIPHGFPSLEPHFKTITTYQEGDNPALIRDYIIQTISCLKNGWRRLDKVLDLALIHERLSPSDEFTALEMLHRNGYSRAAEISCALHSLLTPYKVRKSRVLPKRIEDWVPPEFQDDVELITKSWFHNSRALPNPDEKIPPLYRYFDTFLARLAYLAKFILSPTENDLRLLPQCLSFLALGRLVRAMRISGILSCHLCNKIFGYFFPLSIKK